MTFPEFLEALGRIGGKTNIDNIDDVSTPHFSPLQYEFAYEKLNVREENKSVTEKYT